MERMGQDREQAFRRDPLRALKCSQGQPCMVVGWVGHEHLHLVQPVLPTQSSPNSAPSRHNLCNANPCLSLTEIFIVRCSILSWLTFNQQWLQTFQLSVSLSLLPHPLCSLHQMVSDLETIKGTGRLDVIKGHSAKWTFKRLQLLSDTWH